MKKIHSKEHFTELIGKIKLIKNCIKNNTNQSPLSCIFNNTISFKTKENIQVQIKLYN